MAGWTESSGAAGAHKEALLLTVETLDAGEPTAWVATVKIALRDFFDDRSEVNAIFLETALVLGQENIERMEEHAVEDGALGMSGTVES